MPDSALPASVQEFIGLARSHHSLTPRIENIIRADASLWDRALAWVVNRKLLRALQEVERQEVETRLEIRQRILRLMGEARLDHLRTEFAKQLATLQIDYTEEITTQAAATIENLINRLQQARIEQVKRFDQHLGTLAGIKDQRLRESARETIYRDQERFESFVENLLKQGERTVNDIFAKYRPQAAGDNTF